MTCLQNWGKFVDRERWPSVAFAFTLDRFGPLFAVDELQVVDCFKRFLASASRARAKNSRASSTMLSPSSLIMRPSKSLRAARADLASTARFLRPVHSQEPLTRTHLRRG